MFTSSFVVLQNTSDPNVNTNDTANSSVIMTTGKYWVVKCLEYKMPFTVLHVCHHGTELDCACTAVTSHPRSCLVIAMNKDRGSSPDRKPFL